MKHLIFILLCSVSINLTAQTSENLYHYCKIWGLLKYYTPEAGRGKVNVDELFLATWPAFKQCKDQKDFDVFLQTSILPKFPSINKNKLTDQAEVFLLNQFQNDSNYRVLITFDWVKDDYLSSEVQAKLIGGLNTYKGVKKKWMKTSWGYMRHKEKNIALLPNSDSTAFRTLTLFKYWNWVEYFFAYKNLMDTSWDQDLKHFCQNSSFSDDTNFSLGLKLLSAKLQDHHAAVGVNHLLHLKPNYKEFPFSFRRFGEVYRITSTDFSFGAHQYKNAISTKLKIGDTIESINDFTIKCWDDQISQYISKSKVTDANKFTALENLSYTSPVCMDTDSLYVTVKRANEKIRDTLLPKLIVFDSMQYIEGGLRKMEDNPQIAYISMNYYFYKKNKSNDLKTFF